MKPKPYIGITDFTNFEQVTKMLELFRKHKRSDSQRMLHVGVMTSFKCLNHIENRWSAVYLPNERLRHVFQSEFFGEDIYYCLHYADYDHRTRSHDLKRALEWVLPEIMAVQLDMPWPDPGIIASGIHTSPKNIEVILQIGQNALDAANNDPREVVRRLEDYRTVISRVLLDKSMGRGLGMDAAGLLPFARAIRDKFPDLGLVVAGGLGPSTLNLVYPIVKEFPDISIDAQGKLRPSGNALDPIDWDMAKKYVIRALRILK